VSYRAFLREMVSLALEEEGRFLLPVMGSVAGALQYRQLYELLRKYLGPGRPEVKVLDWGSGNGHFSLYLDRAGFEAWGFSFGDCPLGSRLSNPDRLVRGSPGLPTALPFEEGKFDAVVSVGVLEHVSETGGQDVASLKEIHRILRPGGLFFCYHLPNRYSLNERLAALLPGKFRHQDRYSRRDIVRISEEANLNLLEVRRYGFLPRNELVRLPRMLRFSPGFAAFYDALDVALSLILSAFCQSYLFVAKKG